MNHRGTNLILAAIFLAAVCLFSTFRPRSDAPTEVTAPVSPSAAASTSPLPVETVAAAEETAPTETADASEETALAETADAEPVKPETEPETTAADALPDIDPAGWELLLVNASHNIGDYAPTLSALEGQQFDARIIEALTDFVAAARAEGLSVYLSSGYRDYATQSYLYERKVSEYGAERAASIVAVPGTSEHQTGLACDITDQYYALKTTALEETALYQWMSQHCQEYGFIVRYPSGKEDITGIIYEPWHFRYVGTEAASYIMEHDLCLEEFLTLYDIE
ncbi:MAG: D-alanyl-D-alanine carboxypeptidase family protein [Oscillospiraceae bacterium]|nr:D-alanyl-D-alanine carboxypeptidase family protein [Oscillospiraceae bacterium]